MPEPRRAIGLIAIAALAVLSACTGMNINLPPVTDAPSGERFAGRIIWHDLLTTDIEGSKAFYSGLFGWEYEAIPLSLGFGPEQHLLPDS